MIAKDTIVIVVGSDTDVEILTESKMLGILDECKQKREIYVCSAHRSREDLKIYCDRKVMEGTKVFIAAAGMAAHLAGAIAANIDYRLPVIAVALPSEDFPNGIDALFSSVRMPGGCPVGSTGIGKSALKNAALLALQIIAIGDEEVKERLVEYLKGHKKSPYILSM